MELDFEELKHIFVTEADKYLSGIENGLLVLEIEPDNDENVQLIFRMAHSLKGSAACLGLQALPDLAHAFEDTIERIQDRMLPVSSDLINLLLQTVDALRRMVPDALTGSEAPRPEQAALIEQLSRLAPPRSDDEVSDPTFGDSPRPETSSKDAQDRTQPSRHRNKTLQVDINRLDHMLNLTGEIAIARGRLAEMLKELGGAGSARLLEAHQDTDKLYLELQELVMKVRMIPVGPAFRHFVRTIRDLAQANAKLANLTIEGGEVEVDTTVVEWLRDPLTHMMRNAVDHGLEPPAVRESAGKDPTGSITLRARHAGGSIVIELIDDGAGLDRERIIEQARLRQIAAEPEKMSDQELFRLIFEPGFSTAKVVTDLSGRGVGMDVVRRNIEALRGTVGIDSKPGEGTRFTIRVPLTLAIIDGFVVGVSSETYVIPMDSVVECLELPNPEREAPNGTGVINHRGTALPYFRLRELFSLDGGTPLRENVVVVHYDGKRAGLAVDRLYGEGQAVIKPIGRLFQSLPGIAGSTILGNGRIALILDVPAILNEVTRGPQVASN